MSLWRMGMGEDEGVRQACRNTNLHTSSRLGVFFFFFLTEESIYSMTFLWQNPIWCSCLYAHTLLGLNPLF